MQEKLAILADDLTGATDTAVQFAKVGLTTRVLTDIGSLDRLGNTSDVVSLDTETRQRSSRAAYLKVRGWAKLLSHSGFTIVFKKLDSTLKGNPGSEIEALMDELGLSTSIVAPAVPENQRITVDGRQVVNGRVAGESSFIPDVLRRGKTKMDVRLVPLETVNKGRNALVEEIARHNGNDPKHKSIFVVDATNGVQLKSIAEAGREIGALLCGASALAAQLASTYRFKPVLVICGSYNETSAKQVTEVTASSLATAVRIDALTALRKAGNARTISREAARVSMLLRQGKNAIVVSADSVEDERNTVLAAQKAGLRPDVVHNRIARLLGSIADRVLRECEIRAVILIGGETAFSVLKAIGGYGLQVENEMSPGIPISKLLGGRHEGLKVVTKAGGFGDKKTLSLLLNCLPIN